MEEGRTHAEEELRKILYSNPEVLQELSEFERKAAKRILEEENFQ